MLISWTLIFWIGQLCTANKKVFLDDPNPDVLEIVITNQKVMSGFEAKDVPYQAWVGEVCGGAIISQYYVLSAAHCLQKKPKKVAVGCCQFKKLEEYQVEHTKRHEKFELLGDGDFARYDIGFVKTKTPIRFHQFVQSIKIASGEPKNGDMGLTYGYGKNEMGVLPYYLMGLEVDIVEKEDCYKRLPPNLDFKGTVICADHKLPKHHPYFGDSGGPLVVKSKLVGLVSFGSDTEENLVGYVNVATFRKWIKDHTSV